MLERWDRFAPLTGIWTVVLWLAAIFVIEGLGDTPDEGSPQEAQAYFQNDENSIYVGAVLFFLGAVVLIWWSGALRAAIASEGGLGERLASIVFGAGIATAVLSMALPASQIGGAFAANEADAELSPDAAQALWYAGDGFFVATEFAAALLLVATAIAIFRTRFLPVWLAWLSLVIALVLVIPPIGWAALIFGFPIWIVLTSVLLWRRPVVGRPIERPVTP